MAEIYYESDADPALIASRKVAILGYGSQGHAHALNLQDSGVDVRVGLREGSRSWEKAESAGLRVLSTAAAVKEADVIMVLLPDTEQARVYREDIEPNLDDFESLMRAFGIVELQRTGRVALPQLDRARSGTSSIRKVS